VPLEVICKMMGIPEDRYADVFRCSNIILGAQDPEYVSDEAEIAVALLGAGAELAALLGELAVARRENPTDDLVTALATAEVDGERLTDQEIGSFFILLVVAGNETTRSAIAAGLVALSEHPEERVKWQADFDAVAPTAVEEILRWATPVTWMRRTATRDTELAGKPIKAGDKLLLFYAAANRDESVFADPGRFDVLRNPNPHLAFGGTGPHFCLGAHLARREITEVFRELFTQLPDIRAVGEPQRLRSSFINGIKHVDCAF
jgi:cytochrome P450